MSAVGPESPDGLSRSGLSIEEGKKSGEFRRYRQALAGVYLTLVAGAFALLAASVAKALLFPPPSNAETEASVAQCEAEAMRLLEAFEERAIRAVRAADTDSDGWRELADEVSTLRHRCLTRAGTAGPRGVALADALEALSEVERGFRRVVNQVEEEVAGPRQRVRRALARARGETPPGRAGGTTP